LDGVAVSCPVCGHSVIDTTYDVAEFSALYGPPIKAVVRRDSCSNCTESGDFDSENDRTIEVSLDLSAHKAVPLMAEKLQNEHNCSRPYIERVTGLPQGSIAKCEAGSYNAAVIIALQMACTFPPILMMLDNARISA
jgi:DNA-binding XRE family transcriptional regulator